MLFSTPLPLKEQCNSILTTQEAADGIRLTSINAKELLDDAKFLFDNERYPRAIALAILAIEEVGKIEKIKNLLLSAQKVQSLWRELRSHKSKNFHWVFPMLKKLGVNDEAVLKSFTASSSDSVIFLDQLKQICFYVEAVSEAKKCQWWLPSAITNKELAEVYLSIAHEVVLDDRIIWSKGALEVFKRYACYEDGEIKYNDIIGFYEELCNSDYITQDRLSKIKLNYSSMKG